ncbi:Trehalase [Streptosporangium subroseum]|uniref:Trehalase n=1 Tax=Streptosporangium subroseum TaxID=106412 RepID=A0A239DCH3_9ACTN|nr:Trehalase [Streptosporangium subroseum]
MITVPEAAVPTPDAGRRAHLRQAATHVLFDNWTGAATVPSRALYPHQWSWDSAFIAIGLRHIAPRRAQRELETLLGAQWGDGRIPHIAFNPSVPLGAYFPSPDFWRSSTAGRNAGAPSTTQTSGIVQPPVHALAAWQVHLADPAESRRRGFLPRVYPRLAAWHRYLSTSRDLAGGSLAAVVHPWEPGLDNSPCWDEALARVEPAPRRSFRRADLDHSSAADRPTDLDYARYVRLATTYRDHAYDDARTPHAFAIEDPSFNALLIASEHALAAIARTVGADAGAHLRRAEATTAALIDRLWDPAGGIFLARDLVTGEPIAGHSVSGLVPLIIPGLPQDIASALAGTAHGPRFRLGQVHLVPSYDLTAKEFDANRYWRGPSWFNTAWLIHHGLVRHGEAGAAGRLRAQFLTAAYHSEFAEYLEPYTGEGRGIRRFSWTAALALDLLHACDEEDSAR